MKRTHLGNAGTLNVGDGSDLTKLSGIILMISLGALAMLGMQEASDRVKLLQRIVNVLRHPAAAVRRITDKRRERRALRRRLKAQGWRVFQPKVPGGAAVPIAYDARVWQLLRARSVLAVARTWVGAVGAGPTWAKPKVINVAVLRHRATGEIVEHLNTHMIPSAGRGNLPPKEKAARRRHYADQAARVVRLVHRAKRRGHGVVLTMDANASRMSELVKPFRDAGLRGWTTSGTHGDRGIDHVLTLQGNDVVGAPARVLSLIGFDHRGVSRPLYSRAA